LFVVIKSKKNTMFTSTRFMTHVIRFVSVGALASFAFAFMVAPAVASAAVYAYVDTAGEVKTVTANDWMSAIATAPFIHIHSGVMLLTTAADYTVVGDHVGGAK
jgi:hypothetical protein